MAAAVAAHAADDPAAQPDDHDADLTAAPTGLGASPVKRGHLGPLLQGVFSDLFEEPESKEEAPPPLEGEHGAAEAGAGAVEEGEAASSPSKRRIDDGEVDTSKEDIEIPELLSNIDLEQQRIHAFLEHLDERHLESLKQDELHADDIKKAWGLIVGEHIPVPESKLKKLLDHSKMGNERLVLPRHMMEDVEKWIEIKRGTIPHHENLLALSKPEEPNHFKDTASLKIRGSYRNVQPHLTEAQRSQLAARLERKAVERPPMPPTLSSEEKEKNKLVIKAMQRKVNFLKNPRYTADRGAAAKGHPCPFWFSPESVTFRDYQVGGVYEVAVEFKNVTKVGRRLRLLPCASSSFSLTPMRYEGDATKGGGGLDPHAVIAPGMSAHVKIRFAPSDLNDSDDTVTIATEFGDYSLPVKSRRIQPDLLYQDPVDCGCILAGGSTSATVDVRNLGGEGSFRLIQPDPQGEDGACYYEVQEDGSSCLVSKRFRVAPASFYLNSQEEVQLEVTFQSTDVGRHSLPLLIECDNGQTTSLSFEAIADALRLELTKWPTLQRPLEPKALPANTSPWSLLPWQLNWLRPGVQVGCSDAQTIVISNGGYLPANVEWRLKTPPESIVSLLQSGSHPKLTDEILASIHGWPEYTGDQDEEGSSFWISPPRAVIPPFATLKFTFYYQADSQVGKRATSFACLVAKGLPAAGTALLHYEKLAQLTELSQPEGYVKGLPLFGGAVSGLFEAMPAGSPLTIQSPGQVADQRSNSIVSVVDNNNNNEEEEGAGNTMHETRLPTKEEIAPFDRASCIVTALCLQGIAAPSSMQCLPRALTVPGSALPFLSHRLEVFVRNTGSRAASFRVRLTSRAKLESLSYEPLWVISAEEANKRSRTGDTPPVIHPMREKFVVQIEKVEGVLLGLKVTDAVNEEEGLGATAGRRLLVKSIAPSGLIDLWNRANPQAALFPGDEILDANGNEVDSVDFGDLYKCLAVGGRLTLQVARGEQNYLKHVSRRLAWEWVPLPPDNDSRMPGYGAVATAAVEPDQGDILPGNVAKLVVTMRAPREADLNSCLMIDFPLTVDSDVVAAPPVRLPLAACFRSPRVEMRGASYLDYGVVRAHDRHTAKVRIDNPSDLPMLVRMRDIQSVENKEETEQDFDAAFPLTSHTDVVSTFLKGFAASPTAFSSTLDAGVRETISPPWVHSRSGCMDRSGRHRYKCHGRRPIDELETLHEAEGNVDESANFVFGPDCLVLYPRQSSYVDVTLRTGEVGTFRSVLEAIVFDSKHSQCIDVFAEVQLPQLRLSVQHLHFPITYLKTPTKRVKLQLRNDSDMVLNFTWDVPLKMEAGLEVLIDPQEGSIGPQGEIDITMVAIPTQVSSLVTRLCKVYIQELLQPLVLKATARVFGLEVDYAVIADGELPPEIKHQPRAVCTDDEERVTYPILGGRAPKNAASVDFGELQLQTSKSVQLVLYNRSGIASPWAVSVEKYPAYDPLLKGRSVAGMLDAATRMYSMCTVQEEQHPAASIASDPHNNNHHHHHHHHLGSTMAATASPDDALSFQNEPQPAAGGRDLSVKDLTSKASENSLTLTNGQYAGGSVMSSQQVTGSNSTRHRGDKFQPRSRKNQGTKPEMKSRKRFLLDDKHEKQAFRSNVGSEFAKLKEKKAQGAVALQYGRGWAVKLEPGNDWLQPFGRCIVTLTCYSDLPGLMEDTLIVKVRGLEGQSDADDFRIPMKLLSKGNPLFLPDQQVGLCKELEPPRLSCGTMVPAEKVLKRAFKVTNSSAAKMMLNWLIYSKTQVDHQADERKFINLAICKRKRREEPPVLEAETPAPDETQEGGFTEEKSRRSSMASGRNSVAAKSVKSAKSAKSPSLETEASVASVPGTKASEEESERKSPAEASAIDGAEEGEGGTTAVKKTNSSKEGEEPEAPAEEEGEEEEEEQEEESDDEEMPFQFQMWAAEPPDIKDKFALPVTGELPIVIDPPCAVLPPHGSGIFTVTLNASRATASADAHYHYKLVGKGRFTEDREALLRASSTQGKPTSPDPKEGTQLPSKGDEVRTLPQLSPEFLDDSDSDAELNLEVGKSSSSHRASRELSRSASGPQADSPDGLVELELQEEPDQDVVSTLVLDCVGDVIIPRLTVDKKDDPAVEDYPHLDPSEVALDGSNADDKRYCAMFKFLHSAVPHPAVGRQDLGGTSLGGAAGGSQIPGMVSNMIRNIPLTNRNACNLFCRFRISGPFRILEICQAGKFSVKLVDPMAVTARTQKKGKVQVKAQEGPTQLFTVEKLENLNLQVEFVPELVEASAWQAKQIDHVFEGDITIEYPREVDSAGAQTDLQRIRLVATSRKPAMRSVLVPAPHLDRPLSPSTEPGVIVVEFGRVHVETTLSRKRVVLLLNMTNVLAKWQLHHVGKKKGGKEIKISRMEEGGVVDEKDAFQFDVTSGHLRGPSKDVLVPGSSERVPRWFPLSPAVPHALPSRDEDLFEPTKVTITFRPDQNSVYVSRFRVQVDAGIGTDIICRGTGSYNEEDDGLDFLEA